MTSRNIADAVVDYQNQWKALLELKNTTCFWYAPSSKRIVVVKIRDIHINSRNFTGPIRCEIIDMAGRLMDNSIDIRQLMMTKEEAMERIIALNADELKRNVDIVTNANLEKEIE